MKLPATRALYAYWVSQCRGRCAPDRHDLDPAGMGAVLPYTFMLEVDGEPGRFPIRISGTRLDALFGRDLKGQVFADLWCDADHADMRTMLGGVLDGAQPAVAGFHGAPDGYVPVPFELLVLPLRHHGRTHARLLCGLVPAAAPPWLGLRFIDTMALSSWRFVERLEATPGPADTGGLRRQHLVVYEGGRRESITVTPAPQSRVKAVVARSRDMVLSTHRS